MIPIDASELYSVRMFIYFETSPQSNKYQRVVLNRDQYKLVSQFLYDVIAVKDKKDCGDPLCKAEHANFTTDDDVISLPDKPDIV